MELFLTALSEETTQPYELCFSYLYFSFATFVENKWLQYMSRGCVILLEAFLYLNEPADARADSQSPAEIHCRSLYEAVHVAL